MSRNYFNELVEGSKKFNKDEYVKNFGGIVENVADMFSSNIAKKALEEARQYIESPTDPLELPSDVSRSGILDFGNFHNAPELGKGEVAAVDGTLALPMQKFSVGQALCVGIGSLSYKREFEDKIHGYTSSVKANDVGQFLGDVQSGVNGGINPSAYMRYFEVVHATEISENYIFVDGTLIYEWLANQQKGRAIYKELLKNKKTIGIMKSLKDNTMFSFLGSTLKKGEYFVHESLYNHLSKINRSRGDVQWNNDAQFIELSKKIYRGVFKPRKKFFGFECHIDHLNDMLRIMASDCQMNLPGHEIPYLLNLVDKKVKTFFKPTVLKEKISQCLAQQSEDLFFGEGEEREFR